MRFANHFTAALAAAPLLLLSTACQSTERTLESRTLGPAPFAAAFQDDGYGPRQNHSAVTVGGAGSNNQDFDIGGFSLSGSYGHFFTDDWEVGVRQTANFSDFGNSAWNGSTRIAADYHFLDGKFRPLIGANFGWVYGDGVTETLAAAPEVGFKIFVADGVFLQLLGEYQFFFEDAEAATSAFDDGQWIYSFGFGILLR